MSMDIQCSRVGTKHLLTFSGLKQVEQEGLSGYSYSLLVYKIRHLQAGSAMGLPSVPGKSSSLCAWFLYPHLTSPSLCFKTSGTMNVENCSRNLSQMALFNFIAIMVINALSTNNVLHIEIDLIHLTGFWNRFSWMDTHSCSDDKRHLRWYIERW